MRSDLRSTIRARSAVAPGTISAASITGTAIDLAGFDGATFLFHLGPLPGTASVTPALLHGTSVASMGTVAAGDLIGSPAAVVGTANSGASGTASVQRLGYNSTFRYVKPVFVLTGTANMGISCTAVLSHPHLAPTG